LWQYEFVPLKEKCGIPELEYVTLDIVKLFLPQRSYKILPDPGYDLGLAASIEKIKLSDFTSGPE
jgi:hypothetical protein